MKLSRLKEIDRCVKILALASDPGRQRPGEATAAAFHADSLLRAAGITFAIPHGTKVRTARVREALKGPTTAGVITGELRFSCADLVHPKSLALGQFCFFHGDDYLFVATQDVTLE